MKKFLLLAMLLGLCASSAFSQAQLAVVNTSTTLVVTNSFGLNAAAAASLTNFKVQLFYQPDAPGSTAPTPIAASPFGGSASFGAWEAMSGSPIIPIFPTPGKFNGSFETTGTDVAPNGMVYLEMVGWNDNYSSLQDALNSNDPNLLIGISAVWSQAGGSGAPGTPASTANFFPGMLIGIIPEPSVLALGGLSAVAMLLYRRKRA